MAHKRWNVNYKTQFTFIRISLSLHLVRKQRLYFIETPCLNKSTYSSAALQLIPGFLCFAVFLLYVFRSLVLCCDVLYNFCVQTIFGSSFVLLPFVLFMLFVSIYVCWCPAWFPYQRMFLLFGINMTIITSETRTVYLLFSGIHVSQSFVFCWVCLCENFILSFFVWSFNCLSLELQLIVAALVSSRFLASRLFFLLFMVPNYTFAIFTLSN